MKSQYRPLLLIALAVIVAMVLANLPRRATQETKLLSPPGPELPRMMVAGWVDDWEPSQSELEGHVVVLDCWASWCGPCAAGAPDLVRTARRFRDQKVQFIGLTPETANALTNILQFRDKYGTDWPIGYGAQYTLEALGVEYLPTFIVYGQQGRAVWSSEDGGELDEAIQMALDQLALGWKASDEGPTSKQQ